MRCGVSGEQSSAGWRRMGAGRWERRLPRSARLVSRSPSRLMTADRSRPCDPRSTCVASDDREPGLRRRLRAAHETAEYGAKAEIRQVCCSWRRCCSSASASSWSTAPRRWWRCERFEQPYLFLTKQVMWAVLGLAVLVDRDAHRLPHLSRTTSFIWALLGLVALMLVAVLFSAAGQRHAPLVRHRRPRHSAIGARQAGRDLLHRADRSSGACTASTSWRYSLLPIAIVVGGLVGLILLEPDFGTSMSLLADRRR